jgi:hypothetical protein
MSKERPKGESMSVKEATVSNMWERAAIAEWPRGYTPLRSTSFGSFALRPVPLFFS